MMYCKYQHKGSDCKNCTTLKHARKCKQSWKSVIPTERSDKEKA
jgi:hypothetical protein